MTADNLEYRRIAATRLECIGPSPRRRSAQKHLPRVLQRGPRSRPRADADRRRPLHRLQQAPGHPRDAEAADRPGEGGRPRSNAATRCSPVSTSTPPRTAPCCTPRCGCRATRQLTVDGQDVVADVHAVLDTMGDFTDRLRSGEWTGATGERIKTVVNIGIGGSDLGPVMVYEALRHYADAGISARFVSNVDPADLVAKLDGLDPATTLFIVASKTFSTLETLTNATAARRWLTDALGDAAVSKHFVAVSTNKRLVDELRHQHRQHVRLLGLGRRPVLGRLGDRPVGDGGDRPGGVRGLPVRVPPDRRALPDRAAGRECAGAARADRPVVRQLLRRAVTRGAAVLQRPVPVRRLPPAADHGVQRQIGARRRQSRSDTDTGEIFWGEPGTNGQHAFYQLLHQGTRLVPGRFHRLQPAHRRPADRRRHRQHARPADEQLLRPDAGAGVRQDRRGDCGRRDSGRMWCRTR